MTALAGASGFALVAKKAFDLGSAVAETQSKFTTVFGESSESVQGFVDDFATMAGVEFLLIDDKSTLADVKKELKWNDVYHHLANGFV